jgi:DnaJ like chaperone protein
MGNMGRLADAASVLAEDAHRGGSIRGLVESFPRHRSDYDKRSQRQIAFTIGVIALGAKMAKADGIVTRDSPLILDQDPELLSLSEPF